MSFGPHLGEALTPPSLQADSAEAQAEVCGSGVPGSLPSTPRVLNGKCGRAEMVLVKQARADVAEHGED